MSKSKCSEKLLRIFYTIRLSIKRNAAFPVDFILFDRIVEIPVSEVGFNLGDLRMEIGKANIGLRLIF